jgi:Protein of unknown function (DUF1559)
MRRPVLLFTKLLLALAATGLIVVLIGQVRGAADRTACRNNLRQLGLALHNYHDYDGAFPAATLRNPNLAPEQRLSWLFEIGPFVESVMNANWNKHQHEPWDSEGNLKLRRYWSRLHRCPRAKDTVQPHDTGQTSYVAATGVGSDAAELPKKHARAGIFGYDRRTALAEITDGTAATVMVIETDWEPGPWLAGGPPTARGLDPATQPYVGRDRPFGGLHRGGVMTAMADGSVHLVRKSVSPDVLEALFTIAGGDAHDSPWED